MRLPGDCRVPLGPGAGEASHHAKRHPGTVSGCTRQSSPEWRPAGLPSDSTKTDAPDAYVTADAACNLSHTPGGTSASATTLSSNSKS